MNLAAWLRPQPKSQNYTRNTLLLLVQALTLLIVLRHMVTILNPVAFLQGMQQAIAHIVTW